MKLLIFILELVYIFKSRSFSSFTFILFKQKWSVSSIIESYNHLNFYFKIARNDPSLLWDFYISKEIEQRLHVIQTPYVNMVCLEVCICKYRLPCYYYSLIVSLPIYVTSTTSLPEAYRHKHFRRHYHRYHFHDGYFSKIISN